MLGGPATSLLQPNNTGAPNAKDPSIPRRYYGLTLTEIQSITQLASHKISQYTVGKRPMASYLESMIILSV
jgi:hypothetical protein